MKRFVIALILTVVPGVASAAGGEGIKLDPVRIDLSDKTSLQSGARIFGNFCLSCHSAAFMRYNRMAGDLGISDELIKENLLVATDKVSDPMRAVMSAEDGRRWFGTAPPDLTVIARARSPEWLYTYLRSFYLDEKSPSGWNNVVFENVAMPHVFYEWQGDQRAIFKVDEKTGIKTFEGFELVKPGLLIPKAFDDTMRDLTNFLVYLGEPAKLVRYRIGVYVLIFLAVFTVLAYFLKKEYWKDIH